MSDPIDNAARRLNSAAAVLDGAAEVLLEIVGTNEPLFGICKIEADLCRAASAELREVEKTRRPLNIRSVSVQIETEPESDCDSDEVVGCIEKIVRMWIGSKSWVDHG